jgi:hypothetical protein
LIKINELFLIVNKADIYRSYTHKSKWRINMHWCERTLKLFQCFGSQHIYRLQWERDAERGTWTDVYVGLGVGVGRRGNLSSGEWCFPLGRGPTVKKKYRRKKRWSRTLLSV